MSELYDVEWEKLKSALSRQERILTWTASGLHDRIPRLVKTKQFGTDIIVKVPIENMVDDGCSNA